MKSDLYLINTSQIKIVRTFSENSLLSSVFRNDGSQHSADSLRRLCPLRSKNTSVDLTTPLLPNTNQYVFLLYCFLPYNGSLIKPLYMMIPDALRPNSLYVAIPPFFSFDTSPISSVGSIKDPGRVINESFLRHLVTEAL